MIGTTLTLARLAALAALCVTLAGCPGAGARFQCLDCPAWNTPQEPFQIHGDTYYVGARGLTSILIVSDAGHVLIDGGVAETAPLIAGNIRALGYRLEDVRLILTSHVHFDHAGGVAELQRLAGAEVAASAWSAQVLQSGVVARDDPQYGALPSFAPVPSVRVIQDKETLRVGPLELTARFTPGHTPGGTSWTWESCVGGQCRAIVYADSLTAVSADKFLFTRSAQYPGALPDFEHSFAVLENGLPCDILLTPHPDASDLWNRLARRTAGDADALVDPLACRKYAERARERLSQRVSAENARADAKRR